jgi:hypothetical protein
MPALEHQIRYYGWPSNKKRGMAAKSGKVAETGGAELPDTQKAQPHFMGHLHPPGG